MITSEKIQERQRQRENFIKKIKEDHKILMKELKKMRKEMGE